jgi:hypothetical protein
MPRMHKKIWCTERLRRPRTRIANEDPKPRVIEDSEGERCRSIGRA